MGVYVYRVTAKTVKLGGGGRAHVAKYAYKPYTYGSGAADKANSKMYFRTGCAASARMTLKSGMIVVLDNEGNVGTLYANPTGAKVFYDDTMFGSEKMPKLAEVYRDGKVYRDEAGLKWARRRRNDLI